ncbi:MAG: putative DNA binding domain-containing protein [Prevotellaceae bacterium]|jgi:predicted HTH transcriptional regulator|nr:putative DNA binding domain-containing protein [Prevotellaceae bacterium]
MNIETNRIECKRELNEDLEKEAVAFLNYREGGLLYIGIDNMGRHYPIADIDGTMLKIKDRLKNNILPSCLGLFDVCTDMMEGHRVIKIIFASGLEKPYYLGKYGMTPRGCFVRIGTAVQQMPTQMIETLFAKRVRNSLGRIESPKQVLTFEQLKIYYEAVGKTLNEQFATNLDLLTADKRYNYVGYLMADINVTSFKIAKYAGTERYDLIENNEYGNCSLIKATKSILNKLEVENKTYTKITHRERLERQLWNAVALRESVINSVVHNDYSHEGFPKIEIFDDRIEITSHGGLPQGMDQEEFFAGYSIPRNKEIMRIFRDLDMVEYLGSGVPRIVRIYGKECFKFTDNFVRITFPTARSFGQDDGFEEVTSGSDHQSDHQNDHQSDHQNDHQSDHQSNYQSNHQGNHQNIVLKVLEEHPMSRAELLGAVGLKGHTDNKRKYIDPLMEAGLIAFTIPGNPKARGQKYQLTEAGRQKLAALKNK